MTATGEPMEQPQPSDQKDEPTDDEVIAFAHRMLDLARAGHVDLLGFVDAGLPVDLTGPTGDTLLMLAAYYGHLDTVTALLERGADVHRINDRGQTVLAAAVFKGEEPIVRALLAAGGDPRAGDPDAIETARFFERVELLPLLGQHD